MKIISAMLIVLMFTGVCYPIDKTMMWQAPTTNEDGSPLTDLAGYQVYSGMASGQYGAPIDVKNVTSYKFTFPDDGKRHYAVVTAYDTSGNESKFSNEIFVDVPDKVKPSAPQCSWQ